MHKLKVFGLALVAVFAMGVVVASSASATSGAFTSEKASTTITGTQINAEHVFTTTHGTVKCSTATFHGQSAATVFTSITLTPTYSGCKFAGLNATVNFTSCEYVFQAGETDKTAEGVDDPNKIKATVEIKCNTLGDKIDVQVTGSECIVTVFPQTLGGITLDNSGGATTAMDILATINVSGIDYTVDNPTKCPNKSDVTNHTEVALASYVGEATLTGESVLTAKEIEEGKTRTPIGITVH